MQSYSIHSCANKTLQHSLSYKEGGLISTSVCSLDDSKQKGAEQEKNQYEIMITFNHTAQPGILKFLAYCCLIKVEFR